MSSSYTCSSDGQGQALVFVNDTFQVEARVDDRPGADLDIKYFTEAFEKCGFKVKLYKNLDTEATLKVLDDFAKSDERAGDHMMAVAFSSHGDQMELPSSRRDNVAADAVYCTDRLLRVGKMTGLFTHANCPGMAGKPKLFFIQACRGQKYDTTLEQTEGRVEETTMYLTPPYTRPAVEIPVFKDFLLAYSAPPGYLSFRHSKTGSWFVRCLHDVIMNHVTQYDLASMLTLVKNKVALSDEYTVKSPSPDRPYEKNRKLVPWTLSMLTKDVWFTPQAQS